MINNGMAELKDQEQVSLDETLSGNIDIKQPLIPQAKSRIMALTVSSVTAREWFTKTRESVQPWGDFLNTSKFRAPKSIAPVGKRIVKNIERFQANYMFIFMGLILFCILTSPLLLVAIAACLGACYIISLKNAERKINIMGRELSLAQQYGAIGIMAFPLFWIAGAGGAVFWVIGASFFVVMLHASMYALTDEAEAFSELQMEEV